MYTYGESHGATQMLDIFITAYSCVVTGKMSYRCAGKKNSRNQGSNFVNSRPRIFQCGLSALLISSKNTVGYLKLFKKNLAITISAD